MKPKSVRRAIVIGLIYGPRATKQFDIAFCESSGLDQAL